MRCGTLAYATDQGLGILAKGFYDHGIVTDVLVVEHGHRPTHREWYPKALSVPIRRLRQSASVLRWFCQSVDVMLFFETPFDWELLPFCREHGVRTVLMPMYECMPETWPHQPDAIVNPSLLDQQYFPRGTFVPVPVDVPWRQRTRAEVFVHNAGWGGIGGRNGTREVIDALQYLRSDAKVIIRSQAADIPTSDRAEIRIGTAPQDSLYDEGDVFLFPEKNNGLSLPLQEARASGMLVMATDRFPMNAWLPNDVEYQDGEESFVPLMANPLIPVRSYEPSRIGGCVEFQKAVIDPRDVAAKIDEWYGRDIGEYSLSGRQWAEENSWESLRLRYLDVLRNS